MEIDDLESYSEDIDTMKDVKLDWAAPVEFVDRRRR